MATNKYFLDYNGLIYLWGKILANNTTLSDNFNSSLITINNKITNLEEEIETINIPTKISQLENDSNFTKVTCSTTDLTPGVSELAENEVYLVYE